MPSRLGVTVVGVGKIGTTRATIAVADRKSRLVEVVDADESRAIALAKRLGAGYGSDSSRAVASPETDVVVVSTTNDSLAMVAKAALTAGKHVLVEKPGATNSLEMEELSKLAAERGVRCKIGFNHRFHPGVVKLHETFERGQLGRLCFVRVRHGHGGRLGYEKEWRANPLISGGGELMDQGVHSLDLIDWFVPDMNKVAAWLNTCFWKMKVEDNAMLLLKNSSGVNASLSVSWTQWKPVFSFEVYGTNGFAEVNGLGGAYGPETLTYENRVEGTIHRTVFPQQDESWRLEWDHFLRSIENNEEPMSSAKESRLVMKIVEAAYLSARNSSRVVSLA